MIAAPAPCPRLITRADESTPRRDTVSVCIATCRRPRELSACLDALLWQTEPPDEVLVSDAGGDLETRTVVQSYGGELRPWPIRHCPTPRPALPWQRWWAFTKSHGAMVVFLDDDVRLMPEALARVREAFEREGDLAGVGFTILYDADGPCSTPVRRIRGHTLREWWLGMAGARPGSITAGGITVDHPRCQWLPGDDERPASVGEALEVDWLSGGAMAFRREVLEAIGPLERLFALYDARIGKAEDAVLSSQARAQGRLRLIVGPYARHPALTRCTRTANPQDGYRKGLLETWGRAHVLRWLARNRGASRRAWLRVASLELARALKAALRDPATPSRWQRILGDLDGVQRTIREWHRIPTAARGDGAPPHGPGRLRSAWLPPSIR
jgi:GT2 family glycosyltransferase